MAKPTISLSKVEQEFDLEEMFGEAIKDGDLRLVIGERIIEKMINRVVDDNKGINGRQLKKPYSKAYINSPIFDAFGKSPNDINMTLTGDMLADIQILKSNKGKLLIGFNSDEQIPKAYNHNVGDTLPKRPFFGLNESEIKEIKREFLQEVRDLSGKK